MALNKTLLEAPKGTVVYFDNYPVFTKVNDKDKFKYGVLTLEQDQVLLTEPTIDNTKHYEVKALILKNNEEV